ncbi:MAG: NAD(P)-dependent oxidoreductase [Bryobacteraceae bacterium]
MQRCRGGERAVTLEAFAEIHPPLSSQEAVVEANRCLFCFDAPCMVACPTHIDVPKFIKKIASGNLRGSSLAILDSNILGLSCSRVCPVDVLCEGACVMQKYNKQPIEIGRLQRHAMDHFYEHGAKLPASGAVERVQRIACVGGGPASLSCAAELRRQGFQVTIFDARPQAGGLNTYGVAEYKFRPVDSQLEVEMIRSLGVKMEHGVNVGTSIPLEQVEAEFDAIFLGVGLGPTEPLAVPGEDSPAVVDALHFIAAYKTGIDTDVGRRVVVVGGGNTAIDAANAAKLLGAEEVHLLYRRGESEMPAFAFEYEHAKQMGIHFHWLTQPVAIHAASVECVRMELGAADKSGRRRPQAVPGSNFSIECDMVIPSIGQTKLLRFLAQARGVELRNGAVVVDQATGRTANPKYYAGGDCVNGGREVVDAVAEGKRAALGIASWLT